MDEDFYITDIAAVACLLSRFHRYVMYRNGNNDESISFTDSSGILCREEGFKTRIAEKAKEALHFDEWEEKWIGTGKIASYAKHAMNEAGMLVNRNQQIDFKNRLTPSHEKFRPEAERVLFEIYRGTDEQTAFEEAVETFGAKYDTISFLFFIKDSERFLPVRPTFFEKSFGSLEIEYLMSGNCNWDNYQGFISIICKIQALMNQVFWFKSAPRFIDAHSFVWIVNEEKFIEWEPSPEEKVIIEQNAEDLVNQFVSGKCERKECGVHPYIRNETVKKATKKRANGICQLCNKPAPFFDPDGEPFLEVHHVKWLSRGGKDDTNNTVALCPNCHRKMHILDDENDIAILLNLLNQYKTNT